MTESACAWSETIFTLHGGERQATEAHGAYKAPPKICAVAAGASQKWTRDTPPSAGGGGEQRLGATMLHSQPLPKDLKVADVGVFTPHMKILLAVCVIRETHTRIGQARTRGGTGRPWRRCAFWDPGSAASSAGPGRGRTGCPKPQAPAAQKSGETSRAAGWAAAA